MGTQIDLFEILIKTGKNAEVTTVYCRHVAWHSSSYNIVLDLQYCIELRIVFQMNSVLLTIICFQNNFSMAP